MNSLSGEQWSRTTFFEESMRYQFRVATVQRYSPYSPQIHYIKNKKQPQFTEIAFYGFFRM